MILVRQNGKPKTVMSGGVIICEFDERGTATVDDTYAAALSKCGYIVEGAPVSGEVTDDTAGKTEAKTTRSKRSRNTDTD